jgi:hypothetical protein
MNENSKSEKLSQEELNSIRDQLLESIYADIGRSLVKKALWVIGSICLVGYAYLTGKGHV